MRRRPHEAHRLTVAQRLSARFGEIGRAEVVMFLWRPGDAGSGVDWRRRGFYRRIPGDTRLSYLARGEPGALTVYRAERRQFAPELVPDGPDWRLIVEIIKAALGTAAAYLKG